MSEHHEDAATDLLIKEVDEDLRQEQLTKLWKKYANLFVAGAVVLVLAVAGWQAWQAWRTKERLASGERYADALQLAADGKRDEAAQALAKLSVDGTAGYRVLADLKRADLRVQAGDTAGASAIYHAVAAGKADDAYRDIALLKASYLDLDTVDPAIVEKAVQPLAAEDSPWRHSAREILALAARKRGDHAKAADLFRKLADDIAAPEGVRARAAEMLAIEQPKGKG
ncbi:MAG: tetratricopeptide repeat protein [Magnetospirillum sp.]|nr:tetratricopeptide repeat protein [Magnetospirillum sp.]